MSMGARPALGKDRQGVLCLHSQPYLPGPSPWGGSAGVGLWEPLEGRAMPLESIC